MKRVISTDAAPKAVGPYSQAVASGDLLFCAGQIPLDPKTGEIAGADVAAQTERVCENIRGVLAASGMSFADVVKTTVFLTTMDDFAAMNGVYMRAISRSHSPRARRSRCSGSRAGRKWKSK